jgi:hypothetical protein
VRNEYKRKRAAGYRRERAALTKDLKVSGRNDFSFETFEDLQLDVLKALLVEARRTFSSISR